MCTVDHALFVKYLGDNKWFYCLISTDDVLCSYPHASYFHDLMRYFNEYFNLSIQEGPVLSYLNMRIIQTEHIISLDQAEYIFDMLVSYFGPDITRIKTASTPMRSDSAFEKELYAATPLSEDELAKFAKVRNAVVDELSSWLKGPI